VNIDQLMESLSGSSPDPDHVLSAFHRKRRAARNRMYAASGGLAVAVVAVLVGVLLRGVAPSHQTASGSAPAAGGGLSAPAAAPQASGAPSKNGSASSASGAASCDAASLQGVLTQAVRQGASVIVGYGTLTGAGTAQAASGGGTGSSSAATYYALTLRSVRTLAGPTVKSAAIVWVAEKSQGSSTSQGSAGGSSASPGSAGAGSASPGNTGSGSAPASAQPRAFTPDSEFFGIVSPAASGAPGPLLQAAPVVNGQVLLSRAGCWNITVSASIPASASGSSSQAAAPAIYGSSDAQSVTDVPLTTAEKLAAQSR
jgi:hypothetical protein